MGLFTPSPMELKFGEPVHLMAIRAMSMGAIRVRADIIYRVQYHFTGPHGVAYTGEENWWSGEVHEEIAKLCERIQQDFNERTAAMSKAREYARDNLAVPPLFKSTIEEEST